MPLKSLNTSWVLAWLGYPCPLMLFPSVANWANVCWFVPEEGQEVQWGSTSLNVYPLVIKHGNGQSPMDGDVDRKITNNLTIFHCYVCLSECNWTNPSVFGLPAQICLSVPSNLRTESLRVLGQRMAVLLQQGDDASLVRRSSEVYRDLGVFDGRTEICESVWRELNNQQVPVKKCGLLCTPSTDVLAHHFA